MEVVDAGTGEQRDDLRVLGHVADSQADLLADPQDVIMPLPVADPPADKPVQQLLQLDVNGQTLLVHDLVDFLLQAFQAVLSFVYSVYVASRVALFEVTSSKAKRKKGSRTDVKCRCLATPFSK